MAIIDLIGMGGAPPKSSRLAHKVDRMLDGPMTVAVFLIIPIIFLEMTLPQGSSLHEWVLIADAVVWGAFIAEYAIMLWVTRMPWEYTKRNWLNVLIIITSIPIVMPPAYAAIRVLRLLRGLRALRVVVAAGIVYRSVERILTKNGFAYFLALTLLVMLAGATLIPMVDPVVSSPAEGLWWSVVTTTSFGEYDASVPSNLIGKVMAGVTIVLGIVLISLMTANISAHFVEKDSQDEFSRIEEKLSRIEKRLDKMSKR
jgi:voltage-gated potassium channel